MKVMKKEVRRTREFERWLEALRDPIARVKITARVERVEDGNYGDWAPVGSGVRELRIHYGPGYRVYFIERGPVVVVVLAGGDKGSQHRDIRRAIEMAGQL